MTSHCLLSVWELTLSSITMKNNSWSLSCMVRWRYKVSGSGSFATNVRGYESSPYILLYSSCPLSPFKITWQALIPYSMHSLQHCEGLYHWDHLFVDLISEHTRGTCETKGFFISYIYSIHLLFGQLFVVWGMSTNHNKIIFTPFVQCEQWHCPLQW